MNECMHVYVCMSKLLQENVCIIGTCREKKMNEKTRELLRLRAAREIHPLNIGCERRGRGVGEAEVDAGEDGKEGMRRLLREMGRGR